LRPYDRTKGHAEEARERDPVDGQLDAPLVGAEPVDDAELDEFVQVLGLESEAQASRGGPGLEVPGERVGFRVDGAVGAERDSERDA